MTWRESTLSFVSLEDDNLVRSIFAEKNSHKNNQPTHYKGMILYIWLRLARLFYIYASPIWGVCHFTKQHSVCFK